MLPFAWLLGGFPPLLPQPGHKGGEGREIKLNWKRIKASVDYSNLNGFFFSSLEDPSERQIRRLGVKKATEEHPGRTF